MTPSDYVVAHEGSREDLEVAAGERRRTTLGCMLTFSNGKSIHDRSDWLPHRVYGSNGIIGFAGKTNASPNTIIIGRVGSYCGSLHYSDEECWVTDNAIRANVIDDNDARFAFYLLHTLRLNDWRSGSGQPLLNQTVLSSIPVEIPGPAEQRAIAHILGTLDDKIELNRRMNQTLEEMARALFKSWFVNFDPVRAKAALNRHALHANEPETVAASDAQGSHWTVDRARAYLDSMDPQNVDLFPDRLVDSELGEIPEGWKVGALDDTIELLSGGTPRTSSAGYWGGDIPWYTAKDAPRPSDVFVLETERTITETGIENSAARLLPEETTIITARGTVGRLACLGIPMAMNQTCYGIRGANGYPNFFTYWCVRTAVDELQQRTHGTIFDTITRQTFTFVETVLPPAEHAIVFEATVKPLMRRILGSLHDSRGLAAQRDALLPRLMTGEITVGN